MTDDVWPLQVLKLRQGLSALSPGEKMTTLVPEGDIAMVIKFIEKAGHSVVQKEPAGPGHHTLTISKGESRPT